MNTEAVLALIADLYAQIVALQAELQKCKDAQKERSDATHDV